MVNVDISWLLEHMLEIGAVDTTMSLEAAYVGPSRYPPIIRFLSVMTSTSSPARGRPQPELESDMSRAQDDGCESSILTVG